MATSSSGRNSAHLPWVRWFLCRTFRAEHDCSRPHFSPLDELGLNLTRAEPGTEIWQCWADRVAQCWAYLAEGAISAYYAARDDAERYAV